MEELEGEKEGETEGGEGGGRGEGGGGDGEVHGMVRPPCMHKCCRPTPTVICFFRDTNIPAKGRMIPFRKTALLQHVARVRQRRGKGDM